MQRTLARNGLLILMTLQAKRADGGSLQLNADNVIGDSNLMAGKTADGNGRMNRFPMRFFFVALQAFGSVRMFLQRGGMLGSLKGYATQAAHKTICANFRTNAIRTISLGIEGYRCKSLLPHGIGLRYYHRLALRLITNVINCIEPTHTPTQPSQITANQPSQESIFLVDYIIVLGIKIPIRRKSGLLISTLRGKYGDDGGYPPRRQ